MKTVVAATELTINQVYHSIATLAERSGSERLRVERHVIYLFYIVIKLLIYGDQVSKKNWDGYYKRILRPEDGAPIFDIWAIQSIFPFCEAW